MKTIKMQAVEKFTKLATASFESTKEKIADGSLHEMYKEEALIAQGYDDIQNDVMREFFDVDYYDHVGDGGELGDTYEALCDQRGFFTRDEIELVNAE
jgi:hypothetical protein